MILYYVGGPLAGQALTGPLRDGYVYVGECEAHHLALIVPTT